MKKTFLKIILVFVIMLAVFVAGQAIFDKAFAEEAETEVNEPSTVETDYDVLEAVENARTTVDELKQQVADLVRNIDKYKEENFFNQYILPILISLGVILLSGICIAAPFLRKYFKNKKELAQYIAAYAAEKQKSTDANNMNIEEVVGLLKGFLTDETQAQFDKFISTYKADASAFGGVEGKLETLTAQLQALCNAAGVVWHGSAQAVAFLNAAPTQEAVDKLAAENAKLKEYIRAQNDKGDEVVSKIIAG